MSGDTDRPCWKEDPSYTSTLGRKLETFVNQDGSQHCGSSKWFLKISPLISLLTQIRSVGLRVRWQLCLHCHCSLHANYHLVFCNYLINSGGKVVPLRKIKLLQKFMTKEKHKSLAAGAWTTNVLTHPADSSLHPQTDGESGSVLPPRSQPLISLLLDEEVPWLGACLVQGRLLQLELHGSDQTAPAQLWILASNGRKGFQFRLPMSILSTSN